MSSRGDVQLNANDLDAVRLANASRRRIVRRADRVVPWPSFSHTSRGGCVRRSGKLCPFRAGVPLHRWVPERERRPGPSGSAPLASERHPRRVRAVRSDCEAAVKQSHRVAATAGRRRARATGSPMAIASRPSEATRRERQPPMRATAFGTAKISRDRAAWTGAVAAIVAIVVAVWFGVRQENAASRVPTSGKQSNSSAALYASEAEARAHCRTEEVVFANARSHVFHPKGDSLYGIWNDAALPERAYGCTDDLLKSGYRKSRGY